MKLTTQGGRENLGCVTAVCGRNRLHRRALGLVWLGKLVLVVLVAWACAAVSKLLADFLRQDGLTSLLVGSPSFSPLTLVLLVGCPGPSICMSGTPRLLRPLSRLPLTMYGALPPSACCFTVFHACIIYAS